MTKIPPQELSKGIGVSILIIFAFVGLFFISAPIMNPVPTIVPTTNDFSTQLTLEWEEDGFNSDIVIVTIENTPISSYAMNDGSSSISIDSLPDGKYTAVIQEDLKYGYGTGRLSKTSFTIDRPHP